MGSVLPWKSWDGTIRCGNHSVCVGTRNSIGRFMCHGPGRGQVSPGVTEHMMKMPPHLPPPPQYVVASCKTYTWERCQTVFEVSSSLVGGGERNQDGAKQTKPIFF